jgi:hypothetical protein
VTSLGWAGILGRVDGFPPCAIDNLNNLNFSLIMGSIVKRLIWVIAVKSSYDSGNRLLS